MLQNQLFLFSIFDFWFKSNKSDIFNKRIRFLTFFWSLQDLELEARRFFFRVCLYCWWVTLYPRTTKYQVSLLEAFFTTNKKIVCVIILCSYFHGSSRAFTTSRRERQKKEIFWERWRKVWIRKLRLLLPWSILGLGTKSLLAKVSRCIPHFLPKLASHHSWPCRRSVPQLSLEQRG